MTGIRFIVGLLVIASWLAAQGGTTGTVHLYAITEIGTPIGRARVRIDGNGIARTIDVQGPTSIELPIGVYSLACTHDTLTAQFKIVRVEGIHPIDVIFGLPLANPGQAAGEGDFSPFEVTGTIQPALPKGFGRVK